jgi:hypothetical protein
MKPRDSSSGLRASSMILEQRMEVPEMTSRGIRSLSTLLVTAIGLLSTLVPDRVLSAEIAGLHFEEQTVLEGRVLELRSLAVKEATFFEVDVYAVGLYLEDDSLLANTILSSSQTKALVVRFLREIKRKKLADSWIRDLRASCGPGCDSLLTAASDLTKKLPDVKKGQTITYVVFPDYVVVSLDGVALGTLRGPEASRAILAAVLGERAPRRLREDLLRPLDRARK